WVRVTCPTPEPERLDESSVAYDSLIARLRAVDTTSLMHSCRTNSHEALSIVSKRAMVPRRR
ncbi:MAG TPA: hypothetical protein VKE42_06970, partial [Candidatus Cybelea sp.]|nr:hypothetical protein [Candidatus Cybelea sp.]